MKHPWTDVLKMIDELAKGKLTQIENPNFFDINVLLYNAAVTRKEYLKDLTEKYTEKYLKAKAQHKIAHIEGNIILLGRTIGPLTTIINCKETQMITNHQKNLKEKYY